MIEEHDDPVGQAAWDLQLLVDKLAAFPAEELEPELLYIAAASQQLTGLVIARLRDALKASAA